MAGAVCPASVVSAGMRFRREVAPVRMQVLGNSRSFTGQSEREPVTKGTWYEQWLVDGRRRETWASGKSERQEEIVTVHQ